MSEPIDTSAAAAGVPPHGSLGYLYGYEPVVVFGQEPDGTVEIGRFASFEYITADDLKTGERGERPSFTLPVPPSPEDRVASLEEQVKVLTALLTELAHGSGQLSAPATAAPAQAPVQPPAPAVPSSTTPFQPFAPPATIEPTNQPESAQTPEPPAGEPV